MILDHCVSLLSTGNSQFQERNFTDDMQVCFKLQTGVAAKRLDSLKTALMMLEVMKITQHGTPVEKQHERFAHFVDYIFDKFNDSMAMAIMQYAIKDRKLTIPQLTKTDAWKRVSALFKPVWLNQSKDPVDIAKHTAYERFYARIKNSLNLSESIKDYLSTEVDHINEIEEAVLH